MNEQHLGFKVRQYLNQGLAALDGEKLARLKRARQAALERQRSPLSSPALAWAGSIVLRVGGPGSILSRVIVPMAILILGLVAIHQWQQSQVAAEIEEIDTAMLTGDLPLDAYLDKGFDAWLRRFSH